MLERAISRQDQALFIDDSWKTEEMEIQLMVLQCVCKWVALKVFKFGINGFLHYKNIGSLKKHSGWGVESNLCIVQ